MSVSSWELVRTLIRLTDTSPALGKAWAEVCQDSEGRLGEVQARRLDALDNVGTASGASSRVRCAAAVAGAAVRVAVEAWAASDAPTAGPNGPAAMALRNLDALRDFPWRESTESTEEPD